MVCFFEMCGFHQVAEYTWPLSVFSAAGIVARNAVRNADIMSHDENWVEPKNNR
jgi:hypothetical protein